MKRAEISVCWQKLCGTILSRIVCTLVCNHNQIGLLPQPKYPNKATMVSIQSNIYFIYSHCTDEENMNALDVYTLNGSQLQCLQRIRVNSSSTLDDSWNTNDFYVISTLFWSLTKALLLIHFCRYQINESWPYSQTGIGVSSARSEKPTKMFAMLNKRTF